MNTAEKRLVVMIGRNKSRYGGHSLRAGLATSAAAAGATLREMRKRLVQSLGEARVRSWFDGCRASVIDGVLHMGASTKFRRDYINQEFEIEFENAWKGRVIIGV